MSDNDCQKNSNVFRTGYQRVTAATVRCRARESIRQQEMGQSQARRGLSDKYSSTLRRLITNRLKISLMRNRFFPQDLSIVLTIENTTVTRSKPKLKIKNNG